MSGFQTLGVRGNYTQKYKLNYSFILILLPNHVMMHKYKKKGMILSPYSVFRQKLGTIIL